MKLLEIQAEPEVMRWLRALSAAQLVRVDHVAGLLAAEGALLGMPLSRSLGDGLHELRIHLHPDDVRITYWFAPRHRIVLLTVFHKTRHNERREITRAKQAMKTCRYEHASDQVADTFITPGKLL